MVSVRVAARTSSDPTGPADAPLRGLSSRRSVGLVPAVTRDPPVGRSDLLGACLRGRSLSCPSSRQVWCHPPACERRDDHDHLATANHRGGRHPSGCARGRRARRDRQPSRRRVLRHHRHRLPPVARVATRLRPARARRRPGHRQLWRRAHLRAVRRVRVVEIDRPNRQRRRRRGKSDPQDVIIAARAAQSGDACGEAKTRDGNVETMRVLRVARLLGPPTRCAA